MLGRVAGPLGRGSYLVCGGNPGVARMEKCGATSDRGHDQKRRPSVQLEGPLEGPGPGQDRVPGQMDSLVLAAHPLCDDARSRGGEFQVRPINVE